MRRRNRGTGAACPGKAAKGLRARAAFTVETAMLMPVLFAVIFTCVFFGFHVHNSASLTAFCTEQAVSGHRREADPLLAGAADLKRDWSDNDAARTVSAEVTTPMYGDEAPMKTRKECTYRKEKPVKTVRRAHAVIELTEGD